MILGEALWNAGRKRTRKSWPAQAPQGRGRGFCLQPSVYKSVPAIRPSLLSWRSRCSWGGPNFVDTAFIKMNPSRIIITRSTGERTGRQFTGRNNNGLNPYPYLCPVISVSQDPVRHFTFPQTPLVLGLPWLKDLNPQIVPRAQSITGWSTTCQVLPSGRPDTSPGLSARGI